MAIGAHSDAISVTVLAMMMVGSMSKGDGGGFSIFVFDGRCSVYIEWRLEMLGHPPWGGGALGPLGFAMSIRRC